ncbi:MAG: hypothetical protein ACLQVX_18795 [Limisphaerales bacterium]
MGSVDHRRDDHERGDERNGLPGLYGLHVILGAQSSSGKFLQKKATLASANWRGLGPVWTTPQRGMRYNLRTRFFQTSLYYHAGSQQTYAAIPHGRDMKKARPWGE